MQTGIAVDREACVIRGVKILGWVSSNGREYDAAAMKQFVGKYANARANVNHLEGHQTFVPFESRFGRILSPEWREDGIYGDLQFNPRHKLADAFLWWAENDPNAIGLSHSVIADGVEGDNGQFKIDKIVDVLSVDIVADPATNSGLFEAMNDDPNQLPDDPNKPQEDDAPLDPASPDYAEHLANAVTAVMQDDSMDGPTKKKKIMAILKMLDGDDADADPDADTDTPVEGDDADSDDDEDEKPKESKGKKGKKRESKTVAKQVAALGESVARKLLTATLESKLVSPNLVKLVGKLSASDAADYIETVKAIAAYKQPTSAAPGGKTESVKFDAAAIANTLRG